MLSLDRPSSARAPSSSTSLHWRLAIAFSCVAFLCAIRTVQSNSDVAEAQAASVGTTGARCAAAIRGAKGIDLTGCPATAAICRIAAEAGQTVDGCAPLKGQTLELASTSRLIANGTYAAVPPRLVLSCRDRQLIASVWLHIRLAPTSRQNSRVKWDESAPVPVEWFHGVDPTAGSHLTAVDAATFAVGLASGGALAIEVTPPIGSSTVAHFALEGTELQRRVTDFQETCETGFAKPKASRAMMTGASVPAAPTTIESPAPRSPVQRAVQETETEGRTPRSAGSRSDARIRCQATTRKGSQCLRMADPGSSYCWQHGR